VLPDKLASVVHLVYWSWSAFLALGVALAWHLIRRERRPGMIFIAGWWFTALAGVCLWIPFAWPRYVLPVVPPSLLVIGFVAAAVRDTVMVRLKKSR